MEENNYFCFFFSGFRFLYYLCAIQPRKDAGVVELARLESVYTSKGYQGFESPSFRKNSL